MTLFKWQTHFLQSMCGVLSTPGTQPNVISAELLFKKLHWKLLKSQWNYLKKNIRVAKQLQNRWKASVNLWFISDLFTLAATITSLDISVTFILSSLNTLIDHRMAHFAFWIVVSQVESFINSYWVNPSVDKFLIKRECAVNKQTMVNYAPWHHDTMLGPTKSSSSLKVKSSTKSFIRTEQMLLCQAVIVLSAIRAMTNGKIRRKSNWVTFLAISWPN